MCVSYLIKRLKQIPTNYEYKKDTEISISIQESLLIIQEIYNILNTLSKKGKKKKNETQTLSIN